MIYTTSIYAISKKILTLTLALFAIIWLSWCTTNNQTTQVKTVKIWVIAPLSWPGASFGTDGVNFYKYVTDKFNAENKNVQIQLVVEDGKCSWKDSTSAAQKLIMIDKVDMIWGGMCSSETIAAGKISQANKVFTIAPISSAPEVSLIGDYVYRFYNDTETAKNLWAYADREFTGIALFTENTDYAMWLNAKFKWEFKWDIIVDDTFQSDEKDFGILVSKLKWKQIDWIVLVTQSESTTISFLKALQSANLLEKFRSQTLWVYFCSSNSFLESAWWLANWLRCFDLPPLEYLGDSSKTFIQEYEKTNTIAAFPSRVILQKETADMTLAAIKAWNYTSDSIKKYFESIDQSNPRKGYFGTVYFDSKRDLVWLPYIIEKIVDWKIEKIQIINQ